MISTSQERRDLGAQSRPGERRLVCESEPGEKGSATKLQFPHLQKRVRTRLPRVLLETKRIASD